MFLKHNMQWNLEPFEVASLQKLKEYRNRKHKLDIFEAHILWMYPGLSCSEFWDGPTERNILREKRCSRKNKFRTSWTIVEYVGKC